LSFQPFQERARDMEGAFHLGVLMKDAQERFVGLVVKGLKDLSEIAHRLVVVDPQEESDFFQD
jgi:hypothetical protein